jgi:hypothetical protein
MERRTTMLAYALLFLVLSTVVMVNGCAVGEQYQRHIKESMESYPPPKDLNCEKEKGLLLVDAISKKPGNTLSLSGAAIFNVDDPGKTILSGDFKTGGPLSPTSGVVVFPNLNPGTYRVLKIHMWNVNMWETLFMPTTKEFEIKIEPDKAYYFGQISVQQKFGSIERNIEVKSSPDRKVKSWGKVTEKFPDSSCLPIIREQMESEH